VITEARVTVLLSSAMQVARTR